MFEWGSLGLNESECSGVGLVSSSFSSRFSHGYILVKWCDLIDVSGKGAKARTICSTDTKCFKLYICNILVQGECKALLTFSLWSVAMVKALDMKAIWDFPAHVRILLAAWDFWLKNRWINTFTFVGVLHMKYLLIEPYITKLLFKV